MSLNLESVISVRPDSASFEETKDAIDGLFDHFNKAWENAGEFTLETFKTQADALFEDIGKAWDKTTGSWGDTAGEAISGSLSAIFSGEMDDLDEMGGPMVRPIPQGHMATLPALIRLAA